MKILIYIGYQKKDLTYNDFIQGNHIGGTEILALKLAERLSTCGFQIYLGGNLILGVYNNVTWLNLQECANTKFDIAISASYLHFIDTIDATFKYFWMHNTDYHGWHNGEWKYKDTDLNDSRITGIIALTNWHKNQLIRDFKIERPIYVIGNAIDRKSFGIEKQKIKNSFIYSSAADRGLYRLLEMWDDVSNEIPGATLNVFCPGYSTPDVDKWPKGVTYHGTVDQKTLHNWQQLSEYWLHPTDYEETYCITALEMQYAKVIPITTDISALSEVVNSGYLLPIGETNDGFINIIKKLSKSNSIKNVLREKGYQWSKQQSWNTRIIEWIKLINKNIE